LFDTHKNALDAINKFDGHVAEDNVRLRVSFAQPEVLPSKTLCVKYISSSTTQGDLRSVFSKYSGTVSSYSADKGLAFVNFDHLDDAIKAKSGCSDRYNAQFHISSRSDQERGEKRDREKYRSTPELGEIDDEDSDEKQEGKNTVITQQESITSVGVDKLNSSRGGSSEKKEAIVVIEKEDKHDSKRKKHSRKHSNNNEEEPRKHHHHRRHSDSKEERGDNSSSNNNSNNTVSSNSKKEPEVVPTVKVEEAKATTTNNANNNNNNNSSNNANNNHNNKNVTREEVEEMKRQIQYLTDNWKVILDSKDEDKIAMITLQKLVRQQEKEMKQLKIELEKANQ
jgi:hypothetical protein